MPVREYQQYFPISVPGVAREGVRPCVVHGASGVVGPRGAGQDLVRVGHRAILEAASEGAAVSAWWWGWGGLDY